MPGSGPTAVPRVESRVRLHPYIPPSLSTGSVAAAGAARSRPIAPQTATRSSPRARVRRYAETSRTPMLVRRSTGARTSLPSLPRTRVAGLLETTESTSGIAEPFRPVAGKAFASAPFEPAYVVAEPRPQLPVGHAPSAGSIFAVHPNVPVAPLTR